MSTDDTDAHMSWWMRGANGAYGDRTIPPVFPHEDASRAYSAGRAAYLAAEQAERERLERERDGVDPCLKCDGTGKAHPKLHLDCFICHGTGRRA